MVDVFMGGQRKVHSLNAVFQKIRLKKLFSLISVMFAASVYQHVIFACPYMCAVTLTY